MDTIQKSMGRYAFFNTDLEYKFGFGCQSSRDILLFGGLGNSRGLISSYLFDEEDYESPYHEWSQDDKEKILKRLHRIANNLEVELINFDSYEKNLDGTHNLRNAVRDQIQVENEDFYLYLLGCLIYHQLLYKDILTCTYEV